jgi:very-short-patch-repair endonuclease
MARDCKTTFSRALRKAQTPAEAKLWQALRNGRLDGLKFRRQHPIGPYVADFACDALMLVIELDGGVHDDDDRDLKDQYRQRDIETLGWSVTRFRNTEVMARLPDVLDAIRDQVRRARG